MAELASYLVAWPGGAELALLAEVSVKGAVILLLAGGVVTSWRRASAAQRHLVWLLALGSLLALPAVTRAVPRWHLPLVAPLGGSPAAAPGESSGPAPDPGGATQPGWSTEAESIAAPAGAPLDWRKIALGLWMGGSLAVLGLLAIALLRAALLRRSAPPIDAGPSFEAVTALSRRLGIARVPAARELPAGAMPMTCGVLRPVVLLPRDAEGWPRARLQAVLLHELAHVRRRDILTQVAAQVACALFWFNPLVWMAFRRLRLESERACDDLVLRAGVAPFEYAGHLLELARSCRGRPLTAPAVSSMAEPSQLSVRVAALLADRCARGGLSSSAAVLLVLAGGALCVGVAAAAPGAPSIPHPQQPLSAMASSTLRPPPSGTGPTGAPTVSASAAPVDEGAAPVTLAAGDAVPGPGGILPAIGGPDRRTSSLAAVEPADRAAPPASTRISFAPIPRPRPAPARALPVDRKAEPTRSAACAEGTESPEGDDGACGGEARRSPGRWAGWLVSYQQGRVPAGCEPVGMISTVGQPDPVGYQPGLRWEVTARGGNAIARGLTQHVVLLCS